MSNKMDKRVAIDAHGRVILNDAELAQYEQAFTGRVGGAGTNSVCLNQADCNGTTNVDCNNSIQCGGTNRMCTGPGMQ